MLNLLSNALKFTLEGEVTLRLCAEQGQVRLAVSDTGCGIAPEHLPHIFERFYRVEAPVARTLEGSGIGLSLVRELARLHGGGVSVESALGRGTTMYVFVPLGSAHLPAEQIGLGPHELSGTFAQLVRDEALGWLENASPRPSATPRPERGSRPDVVTPADEGARVVGTKPREHGAPPRAQTSARIVIADDNADMRTYLRRILGEYWEVEAVADGCAALELVRSTWPDLVLADVMMPGLDGFALLAALRDDAATSALPVVLLSARAGEEATAHALAAGAADYVVKPFSARELVARVETQLANVRLQQAERAARDLAERESRARERFLAVLSHELRSSLAVTVGWLELLRRGALPPEGAGRALSVLEQSIALQRRLVEDLLDGSRITAGTLTLRKACVPSLGPQLEATVDGFRPPARERGVRLEFAIEPAFGPVCGDVERLQQVLGNLLGNALKFTPSGGRVRVVGECGLRELRLSVSDTGRGIAPEALPHLFDDFWMVSRHDGRRAGLGLGLAIARSIVELHGGRLTAESEGEGRGATFTVHLPRRVDTRAELSP